MSTDHQELMREITETLDKEGWGNPPAESATNRNAATTVTNTEVSGGGDPPQSAAELLDVVLAFVRRFVVMSDSQAVAAALWVAHAHTPEAAEATPYLAALSPEKRSGKTRLMEVLALLVPRPLVAASATEAAIFRALAERPAPTLFMDEIDTIFGPKAKQEKEALRGLFNAGHRRGTPAIRCVGDGSKQRVERFDVFGPKALAGLGQLPDTIADRSIILAMKRRAPGEPAARFRRRDVEPDSELIRSRLASWAERHVDALMERRPERTDALDDRSADGWEPLIAIADEAGGDWPARARAAAVALSGGRDTGEEGSLGVRLLADVRIVFESASIDRMSSSALVAALIALETAPWGDLYGRALTPRQLAQRLRPYGIRPTSVRLADGTTPKGYLAEYFEDSWRRYVPCGGSVADTPPEDPSADNGCGGVADVADNPGGPAA